MKWWRFLPALAWAGFIFFLSAQETLPVVLPFSFSDKLEHAVAYGVLCVLIVFALGSLKRRHLVLAVVLSSLYGASDEIHQMFVPGRTPDVFDWLADSVGAVAAAGALYVFARMRQTSSARKLATR